MNIDVVALGEPLLEFNAQETGALRQIRKYQVGLGGDTSNLLIAVRRLGGTAGYITRLGDDEFSHIIRNYWNKEGVDTHGVITEPGGVTGIYFISRYAQGSDFIYYRVGSAASHLDAEDVPREYIAAARVFHTSGISQAISRSAMDAVDRGIQCARDAGVPVSYDPNIRLGLWDIDLAKDVLQATLPNVDYVFPSLEDAQAITNLSDPEEIISYFLGYGPSIAVLKMGKQGALLGTKETIKHIPSVEVEARDGTGAGDTFCGAFLVALLEGQPLEDATRFANAAAALSTIGLGAVASIPYRADVEAALQKAEKNFDQAV